MISFIIYFVILFSKGKLPGRSLKIPSKNIAKNFGIFFCPSLYVLSFFSTACFRIQFQHVLYILWTAPFCIQYVFSHLWSCSMLFRAGTSLICFLSESLLFCQKVSKWAICSKKWAIRSFMVSDLSDLLAIANFWLATWNFFFFIQGKERHAKTKLFPTKLHGGYFCLESNSAQC